MAKDQANTAQVEEASSSMGRTEECWVALSRITNEQVQKLLNLIETPKDNHELLSSKCNLLLDSGASYHMIGNLSL